jgi:hypothetical protein
VRPEDIGDATLSDMISGACTVADCSGTEFDTSASIKLSMTPAEPAWPPGRTTDTRTDYLPMGESISVRAEQCLRRPSRHLDTILVSCVGAATRR